MAPLSSLYKMNCLPSRDNHNTDGPMVYNRHQKQMKKTLLTVLACIALFSATAQNQINPVETELSTDDFFEGYIPPVFTNGAYICVQKYYEDETNHQYWYSDTVNVINSNLQVERSFVVDIDYPEGVYIYDDRPLRLEFYDFDGNLWPDEIRTNYTQTLFNNDNNFEYIKPIYSANPIVIQFDYYTEEYTIERFDILTENGSVVNTITLEDGYLARPFINLYKFGNKFYIYIEVANSESEKGEAAWYRIDQQTQSISRVENVPFKVFPTLTDRNSDITVQLEEGTNAREIVVVDAMGREVKSVPVQPGQREVKVSTRGLSAGLGFITDRKNNAVKIIVR